MISSRNESGARPDEGRPPACPRDNLPEGRRGSEVKGGPQGRRLRREAPLSSEGRPVTLRAAGPGADGRESPRSLARQVGRVAHAAPAGRRPYRSRAPPLLSLRPGLLPHASRRAACVLGPSDSGGRARALAAA